MFRSLGALIQDIPLRSRSPAAIVALQVRQVAKESLKTVCSDLPEEVIHSVKPSTFKNGILTLQVGSPLVSSELQMRSEGLIDEINGALGKKMVSQLRFRIK